MKPPKIVMIQWVDSAEKLGWQVVNELDDSEADLICVSVGFLVKESKHALTIVHSITDGGLEGFHGTGQMTIPRMAVKDLTRIG